LTEKVNVPPSGLWRSAEQVRNAKVVAGWIVIKEGSQTYQVGMIDNGGVESTAQPLNLTTHTSPGPGGTLTAVPVDGDTGTGFDTFGP
jgi:hypothetical protein